MHDAQIGKRTLHQLYDFTWVFNVFVCSKSPFMKLNRWPMHCIYLELNCDIKLPACNHLLICSLHCNSIIMQSMSLEKYIITLFSISDADRKLFYCEYAAPRHSTRSFISSKLISESLIIANAMSWSSLALVHTFSRQLQKQTIRQNKIGLQ